MKKVVAVGRSAKVSCAADLLPDVRLSIENNYCECMENGSASPAGPFVLRILKCFFPRAGPTLQERNPLLWLRPGVTIGWRNDGARTRDHCFSTSQAVTESI
jgi:hypothetical protein